MCQVTKLCQSQIFFSGHGGRHRGEHFLKNFFKKSKEKFKKFPKTNFKKFIKKCLHFLQAYIVTGGYSDGLASTETLDKERGSAWKLVASLPSPRSGPRGLGVGNGQFLVAGQYIIYHKPVDS